MYLSLTATLIAIGLCTGLFFIARWRAGQAVRPERGPRMIPWTLIAILAAAAAVVFLAHLGELAGLDMSRRRGF